MFITCYFLFKTAREHEESVVMWKNLVMKWELKKYIFFILLKKFL